MILGSAACAAACGLSGDGTAPDGLVGAGRDGAAGEGGFASYEGGVDGAFTPGMPGHDGGRDARSDAPSEAGTGEAGEGGAADAPDDASLADADAGPSDGAPGDGADALAGDGGSFDAGLADATVDSGAPSDAAFDRQETAAADAGSGADSATDGGACDFNGTWGSRLTIDVTWAPQGFTGIILASGSGQIKQWIKGVRVQTGTSTSDATVVCGIDLPDFQSTALIGSETYGVRFPSTLFDDGYLPTFTVSASLSALKPGATYSTTTSAALLGLTMANPTTDPWPSTITTQVDMDRDNEPGVTIDTAQGSPYSDVPTGIPAPFQPIIRANRLYVAIRQVTIVTGRVTDCDHMSGTVSIPQIQSKYAIDSHVMGCHLVDGGDCTTGSGSQAAFVDNTQPVFTPSGTTDFHSVRLATGATCADVRSALP